MKAESNIVAAVGFCHNAFHLGETDSASWHLQLLFVEATLHELIEQELTLDALELGHHER